MKSENKSSEKGRDSTAPGDKGAKVSGIEKVGGTAQGGVRFPVHNHPEVCDVARTPGGKADK